MKSISLSIPAYNDSGTIENLINKGVGVLSKITADYEIIVIDDGSRDNTLEIIRSAAGKNPRIKVYNHKNNEGFGPTIKEVFCLPKTEWAFYIPGDWQVDPDEIHKLIPLSESADYILGIRSSRNDPLMRRLNSALYNLLISIAAGKKVRDVNSVVLFRRKIMDGLDIRGESAFVHAEIFLNVARAGFRIASAEIEHRPRTSGKGSGNKISVIIPTVINVVKFFLRRRKS